MFVTNIAIILILGLICGAQFLSKTFWSDVRNHWDLNSTFIFALALLLNFPNAAAAFLGGQTIVLDAFGEGHVTYSSSVQSLQLLSGVAVTVLALLRIFFSLQSGGPLNGYVWPLLAILIISFLGNLDNGYDLVTYNQFTAFAVLLASLFASPSRGTATGAGLFGAVYSLVFCGLIIFNSTSAIAECSARKCSPTGVVLPGLNASENAFGLCIVLAIPFILTGLNGRARYLFAMLLGYIAVASGSRSALLGIFALAVVIIAVKILDPLTVRPMVTAVAATAAIMGFALPVIVDDPQAFSTRGRVWQIGWKYIDESPFFGQGSSAWGNFVSSGVIARSDAYSVHNLWLDTLFVSGWIGLILFVLCFIGLLASRRKSNALVSLLIVLIPVLAIGGLERSLSIYSSNWLGWVLPAILLHWSRDKPDLDGEKQGELRTPGVRDHFRAREGRITQLGSFGKGKSNNR